MNALAYSDQTIQPVCESLKFLTDQLFRFFRFRLLTEKKASCFEASFLRCGPALLSFHGNFFIGQGPKLFYQKSETEYQKQLCQESKKEKMQTIF